MTTRSREPARTDAPTGSEPASALFAPRPPAACELPGEPTVLDGSRVLHHNGAGWDGVRVLPYEGEAGVFEGVTRRVLATSGHASFDVRYLEMDPGGYTTREQHGHVQVVICFRGRGQARLGEDLCELGFGDVIHIGPDEPHQFLNPYAEPFGFLCIADRDAGPAHAHRR